MKKIAFTLLTLCLLCSAMAQTQKCGIDTRVLVREEKAAGATTLDFLAKMAPNFDRGRLEKAHIVIGAQAGDIVTLQVPVSALHVLEENREVLQYCIAHNIAAPTMENTRFDTRTNEVQAGDSTFDGRPYNGSGVYIGITDWGFDYTHPNLWEQGTENTRIARAWDQFRTEGPAPAGFNHGKEIVGQEELYRHSCDTSNIYGYATHGTHVAGITAGIGLANSGKHHGQAPGARLLLCTFKLNEAKWLDGVAWMKRVAEDSSRRLVVNSSWGMSSLSCIDGHSLLDQAINNMSGEGVVFVTSAGNNGDVNFHISRNFDENPDTLKTVAGWYTYADNAIGQTLVLWGEEGHDFDACFQMKKNGEVWTSPLFRTGEVNDADTNVVYDTLHCGDADITYRVMVEHSNPYDRRPHIQMDISQNTSMQLRLYVKGEGGTVHAWNLVTLSNGAGNMGTAFTSGTSQDYADGFVRGNPYYGIGEPACAEKAISVAAHIADKPSAVDPSVVYHGTLTDFSSYGPLIDGSKKPEVSAPGYEVVSSISVWNRDGYKAVDSMKYNRRYYKWAKMSGTSMSGPAVTGIVALMLQANPYMSVDHIRNIITSTARNDEMTGSLHNFGTQHDRWGWGKIDALEAVNQAIWWLSAGEAEALRVPLAVYPNPTTGRVTVNTGCGEPQLLQVYTVSGRCILERTVEMETTLDVSNWSKGVYIVRVGSRTEKMIVR